MKKIIHILPFILFLIYLHLFLAMPKNAPVYLLPNNKILEEEKQSNEEEINKIVQSINAKNEKIRSIFVEKMPIILQQGRFKCRAYGELAMEKEKKFRLKVNHKIFGQEMDIGSNDDLFWFWSKRMNPPVLHYSNYENLDRTFLRTALNPNWMLESMNIDKIEKDTTYIHDEYLVIKQNRLGNMQESVTVLILIDPKKELVIGRYLYDENEKILASTEYQNFVEEIPSRILIIWYEEGITLDWDLSSVKINIEIPKIYWSMPKTKSKIDLSK